MVLSMILCVEKSLHNWPWAKNHLLIYHHLKLKGLQHLGIGKPHFERLVFLRITMLRKVCLPLAAGSTITVMEWQGLSYGSWKSWKVNGFRILQNPGLEILEKKDKS